MKPYPVRILVGQHTGRYGLVTNTHEGNYAFITVYNHEGIAVGSIIAKKEEHFEVVPLSEFPTNRECFTL